MYNTQVYLYQQKQLVVLNDYTNSELTSVRWAPVYAKDLKLHKGTDNVLTFSFVNQDQKPVNLTDTTITFRLIDSLGQELVLSKDLEMLNAVTGKAKVTISEADLNTVTPQKSHYTLERKVSSSLIYDPVFVDHDAGGRGVVEVLDSVLPKHTASRNITIPDHGDDLVYNSSTWTGEDQGLQTLQYKPSTFTGSLQVQGAVADDSGWYNIGSAVALTASSATAYITITGYHPYLRLNITETTCSISKIDIR